MVKDNIDEFCVTDELAMIGQADNDSDMGVKRLHTTEDPDEEDSITQLGNEPNTTTKQTETLYVYTRYTDQLSMVNDMAQSEELCEEIGPIKFEPGRKMLLHVKQFKPHNMKELQ